MTQCPQGSVLLQLSVEIVRSLPANGGEDMKVVVVESAFRCYMDIVWHLEPLRRGMTEERQVVMDSEKYLVTTVV